jgi:hypothetical protein
MSAKGNVSTGLPRWSDHDRRLFTGMCLLALLVSVGCSGCGMGKPPVKTLKPWEAERKRVRSTE